MILPLPKDIEQTTVFDGISGIPKIIVLTVPAGEWVPITTNIDIKNFIIQPRLDITCYFATSSGSSDYLSLKNGACLQARVVAVSGTLIGWVGCGQEAVVEFAQGR
jgi:hypothetical protein